MIFVTPPAVAPLAVAFVEPLYPEGVEADVVLAQAVVPEGQTNVEITDDQITISGGEQAGANLFYGFERFDVPTDATADFVANPDVQRVIGRVVGGDSSTIDGLLTVTGGSSDLFIINPAGIIFGPNASLDLPATFTATTAHGLSFGDQWFKATGENTIQALSGTPNGLAFSESSGAIVNLANLSVADGLMLAAGSVIDLGSIQSENGTVQVLSQASGTVVLQDGLLRLDLATASLPEDLVDTTVSLAELLTGGIAEQAGAIAVDAEGNVSLGNIAIAPGNSILNQVNGQTALLVAQNNLHLPSSQLNTTEAATLIGRQIHITDSESQPLSLNAGGRLTIQGNERIDILALYNDQTSIAGGELVLASDGEISLDAHISSEGNIQFTTLDQQSANFISLYDPIISADGNVSFGSYRGPALKVEATGSITADGDIVITSPDTTLSQFLTWDSIGDVLIETSQFGSGPTPAPSQVVLDLEANAVSRIELETFLGLPIGSLNLLGSGTADEGSAITTTFSAQAGDTVAFDWNFVTTNNGGSFTADDFAFVTLTGVTTNQLAASDSPGLTAGADNFENFPNVGMFSLSESSTGPQLFSANIPADGDYTLSIGLVSQNLSSQNSLLLIEDVAPTPTIISDESLLATSQALILRAGETVLQNPANLPQLDVPTLDTDFTDTDLGGNPASITVNGFIDTSGEFSDFGGPVILSAPGNITLNDDVSTASLVSGNIFITGGEINARRLSAEGGFENTGSVTLRSTTGDITVETILAGSGGVDIEATGLFQATGTFNAFPRITLNPVEDADLISFLQTSDPDGFSQLDLTQEVDFEIPTSIATSPDSGPGRIRIRHGGAGNTISNENYDIQGTETANSTPFLVGPNTEGVTITVEGGTQEVSGFIPLFEPGEFPTDTSGTNGAIAQLTGDGSLATAFFNEPFVPEIPVDPVPNPDPNPGPIADPTPSRPGPGTQPPGPQPTEPSGPEFSTADTDNLEETEDEENVATESDSENLLALRGTAEECDADEITQEDGIVQLSGDCLEGNNTEAEQSNILPKQPENQLDVAPINDVSSKP